MTKIINKIILWMIVLFVIKWWRIRGPWDWWTRIWRLNTFTPSSRFMGAPFFHWSYKHSHLISINPIHHFVVIVIFRFVPSPPFPLASKPSFHFLISPISTKSVINGKWWILSVLLKLTKYLSFSSHTSTLTASYNFVSKLLNSASG